MAVADVAGLAGVKETTVWRWCREGRLSCLKVGKHWRIRRGSSRTSSGGERPAKLFRRMDPFLRVPDNVLAIARDEDLLRRIDAAFFRAGEARGGLLW